MTSLIYSYDEIKNFLIKFPYYYDYLSDKYKINKDINNMGVFQTENELYVVGDVHGDLSTFIELLLSVNIIIPDNKYYKWNGGNKYLIQTGDILDRKRFMENAGDGTNPYEEIEVIMFLFDLNTQAMAHGRRVIGVVGNHELMNLCGDFRYVCDHHLKGCDTLTTKKNGRKYLFSHNPRLTD